MSEDKNTTELNQIQAIKENVREKLTAIIDPDLGQDIVTLGFISLLEIKVGSVEGKFDVYLTLELTTPACPVKENFRTEAIKLIKTLPQINEIEVTLGARQKQPINADSTLVSVKHVIAISSCKGGVGKSTVSAWLAYDLAMRGYKVGLLDLDIFGPSLPTLFGLRLNGVPTKNKKLQPHEHSLGGKNAPNILKLMSFGFLLGDSPAIMRGPMVSNYIQQLLHQVEWGELDYLFIDMPPGTGDTQLTLSQTVKLDGTVIVTTPQSLSLVDVARGIIMFEKVNVPMLGLIENMTYFVCNGCEKKHYPFSNQDENNKSGSLQERFGIPLLAELPLIAQSKLNFTSYHTNQEVGKAVDQLIRQIGKRTLEKINIPKISEKDNKIILALRDKIIKVGYLELRANCRCALCTDEFTGEIKLDLASIPKDIHPLNIEPLGNYALSIVWSDQHSSGIYPYKMMLELGEISELI